MPYSRAEVFEAWPQIQEVVFGDQFSVYAKVAMGFDSVRGWQVFVAMRGTEAEAAQAYLEEHFAGRVSVLPDLEMLTAQRQNGPLQKISCGWK